MKRFLIAAAAALTVGCLNDVRDGYEPVVEIVFMPVMYSSVRAPQSECPDVEAFGVSAWQLPEGCGWNGWSASAEEFFASERVACSGGEWCTAEPARWPAGDSRLTFIGYAPYGAAAECCRSRGVVFAGVDTSGQQGCLLYTDPLADVSKFSNGGIVPIVFRHALCEIAFRAHRMAGAGEKIVVRRITMDAVHAKGDFSSLPEPRWTVAGERSAQLFFDGSAELGNTPRTVGDFRFAVPQRLETTVTVEFECTGADGRTERRSITTQPLKTSLEAGRRYTCTLSVGPDTVMFLQEIIESEL